MKKIRTFPLPFEDNDLQDLKARAKKNNIPLKSWIYQAIEEKKLREKG